MGGIGPGIIYGGGGGSGTVTEIDTGTGLTGGPITGSGLIQLASIASGEVLANTSGTIAAPLPTGVSQLLDSAIGNTQGAVLTRQGSAWVALAPGAIGDALTSGGASANLEWAPGGTGSVVSVATGTGLTGGPITGSGTIAFATVADGSVLANVLGSTAAPAPNTLTAILDHIMGSSVGTILQRGSSGWSALAAGSAGEFLTTGGSGQPVAWSLALPEGTATEALNVYNFQDWFNTASGSGTTKNTNAWTNLLAANNAASFSGQVWFQAQVLQIAPPTTGLFVASGTRISGIGNGNNTSNALIPNSYLQSSVNGTMFQCGGAHDPGGRIFENLGFNYTGSGLAGLAIDCSAGGTAGSTNVVADTCSFYNWPCAFQALGNDVSCGLIRCEINVDHNVTSTWAAGGLPNIPSNVSMVTFAGPQQFCIGPIEVLQQPWTNSPAGPTGLTFLAIDGPAEHSLMRDMHVSDFAYGISFAGLASSRFGFFSNNEISVGVTAVYAGLNIVQSGSAPNITGMKFFGNYLRIDGGYVSGNTTPIVYVDTNGGANTSVNDFDWVGNTVYSGGSHGFQFNTGSGQRVIGGVSSSNGPSGAGVAITGAMGDVLVLGTNLTPYYFFLHPSPPAQEWAVSVTGNVIGPCQFAFANMQNYGSSYTNAVSVTGTPASSDALQFVECLGYNDTLPALTTSLPTSGTSHSDGAAHYGYYGPSVLYISGGVITGITIGKFINTTVSLSTTPTALALPFPASQTVGLITVPLRPGFGYSITYTGTPTLLLVGV